MLFCRQNQSVHYKNRFVWFKKWVLERQTYSTLSRDSGLSKDTLQRTFYYFLSKAPIVVIIKREQVHLRIDATYFKRFCLMTYQDNDIGYTQLYRFTDSERYEEIREDLVNLKILGVAITSITCDGHKAILKAIKKALPEVLIQRCMVHIQRMCLIWLTPYPQSAAAQELKPIIVQLHKIKTHNDRLYWLKLLNDWYQTHQLYLQEKSINISTNRYWYKHKLLRRAYFTIKRALPNMFHYLDNPFIPKTTNGIESYFGHLKNHLDLHRGLTSEHRKHFIMWYFYFKNNNC